MLYAASGRTASKERHRVFHKGMVERDRCLGHRGHRRALAARHAIKIAADTLQMGPCCTIAGWRRGVHGTGGGLGPDTGQSSRHSKRTKIAVITSARASGDDP